MSKITMLDMTFSNFSVLTEVVNLLYKWLRGLEGWYNSTLGHRHSGPFPIEKIKTDLYNAQKGFKPLLVRYDDVSKCIFANKKSIPK